MRALLLSLLLLAVAAPAAGAAPKLHWHDCYDDFQCATAELPRDYAKPHGATVKLAVIRHLALDREHRIGSLFLNPGGPGSSGVDFVRTAPPQAFAVLPRFDWIGWDPRGVAASKPAIDCDEAPALEPMTPDTLDVPKLLARGRMLARTCLNRDPRFLASVNTGNAARDLDQLRAAVGDTKLTYIGISWGGMLGETYASLFPGRSRAMLLDSPIDADVWLNRPFYASQAQNVGFEHALQRFLAANGMTEDRLDALLAQFDEHPADLGDGRTLDGVEVRSFVSDGLVTEFRWAGLAAALAGLEAGDVETMRQVEDAVQHDDPAYDALATYLAVERRFPHRLAPFLDHAEQLFTLAPHFAFGGYEDVAQLFWPVHARGAFYGPFRSKDATPPVVVHTTHDPATPFAWGKKVARTLGGRLLTYRGDGHGVVTDFNACVFAAMVPYLEDLELPPKGASCDQSSSSVSRSARNSWAAAWMRAA